MVRNAHGDRVELVYDRGVFRTAPTSAVRALADLVIASADRSSVETALRDVERVRRWLAAKEVDLHERLGELAAWPEKAAGDATGQDLRHAEVIAARKATIAAITGLGAALEAGQLAPEHVDVLGRVLRGSEEHVKHALTALGERLVELARSRTPTQFRCALLREVRRLRRGEDGEQRLARQQGAVRLRGWFDESTGMYRFAGELDPVTGAALHHKLDAATNARFRDGVPVGAPSDVLERQAFLRALALLGLVGLSPDGEELAPTPAGGGWSAVVVVDTTPDEDGVARIDWGLPVELPFPVLERVLRQAAARVVMIRDGIIIDPTGALDHGRHRRLGTSEQRIAMRACYSTCAIPGCTVRFEHTKLHHVTPWEHGGPTDLDNLVPLCEHHHHAVHDRDWRLHLAPDRTLTISLPDGTVHTTGPPSRAA